MHKTKDKTIDPPKCIKFGGNFLFAKGPILQQKIAEKSDRIMLKHNIYFRHIICLLQEKNGKWKQKNENTLVLLQYSPPSHTSSVTATHLN